MPWVVEDTYGAEGGRGLHNTGELRNPNFPSEVWPNEAWAGSINAVNVGNTRDKFRVRLNGEAGYPFYLDPGSTKILELSGSGPSRFTIYLERETFMMGMLGRIWEWMKDHQAAVIIGSAVGVGATVYAWRR